MTRRRLLFILIVAMVALLAIAVPGLVSRVSASAPPPTPPPVQLPDITLADLGHTIQMHVGDTFNLNLDSSYDWSLIKVLDPSVVDLVPDEAPINGGQGVYQALKIGTTSLLASGEPFCRQSNQCTDGNSLFEVHIIVY